MQESESNKEAEFKLNSLILRETRQIEFNNERTIESLLEQAANSDFVISALEIKNLTEPDDYIFVDRAWAETTWRNYSLLNPDGSQLWFKYLAALKLEDQGCGFFLPDPSVLNSKNRQIVSILAEHPKDNTLGTYDNLNRKIDISPVSRYIMSQMLNSVCTNIIKYPKNLDNNLPNFTNAAVLIHEMAHDFNVRYFNNLNRTAGVLLREVLSDVAQSELGLPEINSYADFYLSSTTKRISPESLTYKFDIDEVDIGTAELIEYKLKLLNALGVSTLEMPKLLDDRFKLRAAELNLKKETLSNGEVLTVLNDLISQQSNSRYGLDVENVDVYDSVGKSFVIAKANKNAYTTLNSIYLGIEESFVPQHDFAEPIYIGYDTQGPTLRYNYALKMDDEVFVFAVCTPSVSADISIIDLDVCETSSPFKPRLRGEQGLYCYLNGSLNKKRVFEGKPPASYYIELAKGRILNSKNFPYVNDEITFKHPFL